MIDSLHAECNEGTVKSCPVHGRIDKDQYDGDGCNKFCEVEVRLNWMPCVQLSECLLWLSLPFCKDAHSCPLSYSLDSMSIFMHHSYTWVILMLRVINAVCGWMVLPGWRSERWLRWTHTRPVHVRPVLL